MEKQKMCSLQFFCLILIALFAMEMYAFPGIPFDESIEESWIESEVEHYLAKSENIGEMKNKGTPKKPRFLCLHGHDSNATRFKDQFNNWPDFVVEKMDLVFITGPFLVDEANEFFEWFIMAEDHSKIEKFDEGIAYIENCMVELGPFDGVIGLSQGAIVTGALPGLQAHGRLTKVGKIKYVIIIAGGKLGGTIFPLPKLAENIYSPPIDIPSLHIFGKTNIPNLDPQELVESYVNPLVIFHHQDVDDVPKLDEDGLKIIFEFFKKINAIV